MERKKEDRVREWGRKDEKDKKREEKLVPGKYLKIADLAILFHNIGFDIKSI